MEVDFSNYSEEQIDSAIEQAIEKFKTIEEIDMSRLKRQIEITKDILVSFSKGKKIAIIDAPTGFGKSILGFFIHYTSEILIRSNKQDNESGEDFTAFILTSNKFLQEQYLRDIQLFKFHEIKMLKGQSNYFCNVDKTVKYPSASCKDIPIGKLTKDGGGGKFPCYVECDYVNARSAAIRADNTVFNYAYFLSTMNHVTKHLGSLAPFQVRPLTIFDECHVLGNIVSDTFSLTFNPAKFIREIRAAASVIATQRNNKDLFKKYSEFEPWLTFNKLINELSISENNAKENLIALKTELLENVNDFAPYISEAIRAREDDPENLSTFHKYMCEFSETVVAPYHALSQQIEIYDKIGFETAVISTTALNPEKNKYLSEESSRFNKSIDSEMKFECTNEAQMIKDYALTYTNYSILMSATIGKPEAFAQRLELSKSDYECFEVTSDFDYKPSPIFKVHPMISMSYKDKMANMPKMMQRIIDIADKNPNVRGLIHTGNFEIMRKLQDIRHPRILTYSNSLEKEQIIELLKSKPNAIVAGPSLIEGVDLKDDLCRFMIYAKVPYLSLASKLNKRKMELYKDWYNFQTLISFQQGLGRAVRHKEDWCKTYLLDASFESFFSRYKLPNGIETRLVDTQIDTLDVPMPSADDEFEAMLSMLKD